ncbi:MAG: DUF1698 domain-containing protein [Candidatus Accumulibacter meliphilus]|jgi:2-polyprenyl-3-methyl-5-hydroxy-6-metoxy-1,4-benzoquinol methylase|uniref:class I SAM-dependent methyltransferase n=1 Tax=Candidatus Accumulibacter meliphilus TaxID=2211374 RepID=UPI002FC3DA22
MLEIKRQIEELKPWWEDVSIRGVSTKSIDHKAGRNKDLLFSKLFDVRLGREFFQGKSVIDLGCNAGGSTIEMLSRGASFVTCVEGSEHFFRQLRFVINNTSNYQQQTKLIAFSLGNKTEAQLDDVLGSHDIGFCIGLIYHMKRADVISLMRYMMRNTGRCIFSSPTTSENRSTDWTVDYGGIDMLLEDAGFKDKVVLLDAKKGEEDWSWMTNTYYFEALR